MASGELIRSGPRAPRAVAGLRCSSHLVVAALGLNALLPSCSQILGASEYSTGALQTDPAIEDNAAPDSQPAFLAASMCVACTHEHCSDTLAACETEPSCSEALSTVQQLTEPLIASGDWMRIRADAQWAAAKGQVARAEFAKLFYCIQSECAVPCEIGRDFSCAGRFDYERRGPQDQLELRLRTMDDADGQSLSHVNVSACATQADCSTPLGNNESGEDGLVQLSIDLSRAPVSTSTVSFTGVLLFESAREAVVFSPQLLQQTRPWHDQDFLPFSIVGRAREMVVAQMVERMKHAVDLIPVQMQVQDCNDRPAEGLKLEIWSVEATGYRKCERCLIAYLSADAIATDPVLDRTSTAGQAYAVVPEGEHVVTVRDATDDRVLSVIRPFVVSSGTFYDLNFYPASRDQRAQLPKLPR